uniref:Peptidase S74 domain-containing protein n=1 Tax=viral metagenome TaxID=1070528 RepID=A0A6C0D3H0_9ZZZZ
MEIDFNVDRRFIIFGDKLTSIDTSRNLIIESSYNTIDFSSNIVIFDGRVDLSRVICNNIDFSNVSEISSNFLYVDNINLPTNNKLKYNSVNNGYIGNTIIGINPLTNSIGRSDAFFTYINVSGGDSSFNSNVYINNNLRVDGTLTISNDLLINGNNFASVETSFNLYREALEDNFNSAKIITKDLSASAISISNNLYVLKTAYFNDISINGLLLNNVLKVPALFTIDPSGHGNSSGTLIINGDLVVNGIQTSIASSVVDICDQAIMLASSLANIQNLSNTNAGLDISNIASLKYNGTLWNFSGGQLNVQNNKVLFIDDISLAKRNFDLSLNTFRTDLSSSFFTLKRNIDNSYNATYRRSQIDNSFILRSNFDISLNSLRTYTDSSYISKNTFSISYGDLRTLMDTSYVQQRRVEALNSFDSSFNTFTGILDLSYLLRTVFDDSLNKIKTDFDISFATINANNINTSAITIETINTSHYSQRFGNNLWNIIGQDISFSNPICFNGISNNGRVVALTDPSNASSRGRLYVYEISSNGTSYSWQTLGLSSEIMVGQTTNTLFGGDGNSAVALSSDGRVVAVSDTLNDISDLGQVRVFELSANRWVQRGQLINGKSITNYKLGYNVALSGNGNILAASSRLNKGEVLVYELSANINSWIRIGQDISGANNNQLGFSMSLSLDGTILAAGYRSSTLVEIYRFNSSSRTWTLPLGSIIDGSAIDQYFGWNIKLSSDGNTIVIGGIGAGASAGNTTNGIGTVSVFKYNGTSWSQLGQTISGSAVSDLFGKWVQISNDGTLISAGGDITCVRVYKLYLNTWTQLGQVLNGTGVAPNLGLPMHALSGDGTTLVQIINKSGGNLSRVYGMDKSLTFTPSTTSNINTTISGGLIVGGRAYLKSLNISNRHNFDGTINGYSSHYLASTDISASIVDYYSNVGYTYNRVFRIDAQGNVTNYSGSYTGVSDSRLKENIVNCTPKLEKLLKVRVVNYNLKGPDKTKYIGVVAQELEELFPELIHEDDTLERFKSVNYSYLTLMLIKAFQEQQVLINNLNATLKYLESEL